MLIVPISLFKEDSNHVKPNRAQAYIPLKTRAPQKLAGIDYGLDNDTKLSLGYKIQGMPQ
jgi:hypothetical protein